MMSLESDDAGLPGLLIENSSKALKETFLSLLACAKSICNRFCVFINLGCISLEGLHSDGSLEVKFVF